MNGIGVGLAVAVGALIGLTIVAPAAQTIEYVATGAFYGIFAGVLFELYRWSITTDHPLGPNGRHRR